jgi:sporulation protein YlmC with PRC-barrel domain
VRTLSSLQRRKVVTESGESLGRLYDLRGELTPRTLRVTGLVAGTRGLLEHLGVVSRTKRTQIPWSDVVRIEGERIVVRDQRR